MLQTHEQQNAFLLIAAVTKITLTTKKTNCPRSNIEVRPTALPSLLTLTSVLDLGL